MTVKLHAAMLAVGLVISGGLALFAVDPQPLQNPVVYVDNVGNCDGNEPCLPAITIALGLVDSGGRIFVYGGTYLENFTVDIPVTIQGAGRDLVTVDADWLDQRVIQVSAADVMLDELTLMHADYGIEARSTSSLTVRGVRITDTYGGILAQSVNDFRLDDSHIYAVQAYDGVEVRDSMRTLIDGSNVSDNAGQGILILRSQDAVITDNVISGNTLTGLNVSESINAMVENNTIENNGGGGPSPFGTPGPGPVPLNGGGGGLRFWQTDPTAVERNTVRRNAGFGIEIVGGSGFSLSGNLVEGTDGDGVVIREGAVGVALNGDTIRDNSGWGVLGQQAFNVAVANAIVEQNGPVPGPTRSGGVGPLQGGGGGLRFWQTDPSEVRGTTVRGNFGPGIELEETMDFNLTGNTIETTGGSEGILLLRADRSLLQGNSVRSTDPGFGTGTALIDSQNVQVLGNAYENLDTGIRVQGGCHLRFGGNTFVDVTTPFVIEGNPCDVTFAVGSLRFMPRTLNLRSQGQYVTLRFEVEGLDPGTFEASALTFDVNGVILTPPGGSASQVSVHGDVIRGMVKLDRAACIAAFGTSGTYTVTVLGEVMPGVTWSASDTVDAILP